MIREDLTLSLFSGRRRISSPIQPKNDKIEFYYSRNRIRGSIYVPLSPSGTRRLLSEIWQPIVNGELDNGTSPSLVGLDLNRIEKMGDESIDSQVIQNMATYRLPLRLLSPF